MFEVQLASALLGTSFPILRGWLYLPFLLSWFMLV